MTSAMIINTYDYSIIQNDVSVLTRTATGTYASANCYLGDLHVESENLKDILSGFDYKDNILRSIKQYGHSPYYSPVLRILTNTNIQTPDFNIIQDILAIALFLDKGKDKPIWLDYFEVNRNFRRNATETQKHKTVGGSMLTSLQQEYTRQGIEGRATYDALPFYCKYGFKRIDNREIYLRWQPQR